jgi:hypothetical protein
MEWEQMALICTEVTGVLKEKKEAVRREDGRNQSKVKQMKSYKNKKGMLHMEAMWVCLLLLPNTNS